MNPFRRKSPLDELLESGYEAETPMIEGEGYESQIPFQSLIHRLGLDEEEETPGLDAYRQHLEGIPERDSYRPDFGQKLLYGLVGAGQTDARKGMEVSRDLVEHPYKEALEDWGVAEKGLRSRAEIEGRERQYKGQNLKRYMDILNNAQLREQGERRLKGQLGNYKDLAEDRRLRRDMTGGNYKRTDEDRDTRIGLERQRVDAMLRNVNSQIRARGERLKQGREGLDLRKKGSANKPRMTEKDIHTAAVGNVMRDNPEFASIIDRNGLPKDAPDSKNRYLYEAFNAELEKQKMILRNRYLGSDLQRPVFAFDDEELVMPEIEDEEN